MCVCLNIIKINNITSIIKILYMHPIIVFYCIKKTHQLVEREFRLPKSSQTKKHNSQNFIETQSSVATDGLSKYFPNMLKPHHSFSCLIPYRH